MLCKNAYGIFRHSARNSVGLCLLPLPRHFSHSTVMATTRSPFELKPKHTDFKKLQASRPKFDSSLPITLSNTPNPDWKYGQPTPNPAILDLAHVEIDPTDPNRPMVSNYRLMVSGIPRPISFISTVSKDGQPNLAPMSYFQVVDHDPPTLVVGFSARPGRPKDTMRNLVETGECVINIVSEHFVEAVNATSMDPPHGQSEWGLSGLTPAPASTVRPDRVKEAVFSIEGRLLEMKSLDYHGAGKAGRPHGSMAIIEATRFWVREDAVNEAGDDIDVAVLRPLVQLGGIQYARVRELFELPRPSLAAELKDKESGVAEILEQPEVKVDRE